MTPSTWTAVDDYLIGTLAADDDTLEAVIAAGRDAGLPPIEVSASQGKLLALLAEISGASRVLEFGTLAGYSAVVLARAVGPTGQVTTLEIDPHHAEVARSNFQRARVAERIELIEGPAAQSARKLIDDGTPTYDFVFIDADKPSNPEYLDLAMQLTHPGSVIVVDNVVRDGAVADADSTDPGVQGSRAVLEMIGANPRLDATAIQTVGKKGYDGFAIARVL